MLRIKRSQKEKRIHYSKVAKGEKPVKQNSKYSESEQIAYAKGQRDARNESARICALKNSTPAQIEAYNQKRKAEIAAYKAAKAAEAAKVAKANAVKAAKAADKT